MLASGGGVLLPRPATLPAALRLNVKLVLVTETYPPEVNGAAMTLQRLVRGLALRGHGVTVIRPRLKGAESKTPADPEGLVHVLVPSLPLPLRSRCLHFS